MMILFCSSWLNGGLVLFPLFTLFPTYDTFLDVNIIEIPNLIQTLLLIGWIQTSSNYFPTIFDKAIDEVMSNTWKLSIEDLLLHFTNENVKPLVSCVSSSSIKSGA